MNPLTQWWVERESPASVAQTMWDTWYAPHRAMLLLALRTLGQAESLYELGCGSGPNLRLLHDMYPLLKLGGSEPSPGLAAWASEHLGITIDQDELPTVTKDRWDVFLACYALAYVEPQDTLSTLRSLDGRAVIIMEPNPQAGKDPGLYQMSQGGTPFGPPEWHHDYPALLADSGWRMTWRWPIVPAVQGLNAVIIAER